MARNRRNSDVPFGETVERLLVETGMTYRTLAEKTGLSAGYINHVVHGNRPVPSNEILTKLARALGVDAAHFLEYRVRAITEQLERQPKLVERLYKQLR
jgi:transcriptional regulator with XRE-family HTH domain